MTHSQITAFLSSVADLIRDTFKRGKYQNVILPLTVLRRIDQVLEPTKENVLKTYSEFKGKLDNPDDLLRKASGYAFYNTSLYTFELLVDDPQNIAHNLRTYIQSFSPNMREVIEKFDFDNTITKLDDAGLLFQVMEKFAQVDLHPDRVSTPMMGTILEGLIWKFNAAPKAGESAPGESVLGVGGRWGHWGRYVAVGPGDSHLYTARAGSGPSPILLHGGTAIQQ